MGLPTRYHHPEHGLCVTLPAALAHLAALGIAHEYDRHTGTLMIVRADGNRHAVEPLALPVGAMYPIQRLQDRTHG